MRERWEAQTGGLRKDIYKRNDSILGKSTRTIERMEETVRGGFNVLTFPKKGSSKTQALSKKKRLGKRKDWPMQKSNLPEKSLKGTAGDQSCFWPNYWREKNGRHRENERKRRACSP